MLLLPFLLFLSQFRAASSHYIPSICNISVSIGQWFKDNPSPGSCDIVKGHFILDKTANKLAGQIFSVFSNLTRIEGCIYIKGYTGSKNLSFFSNLEDVNCDEEEALRYNLTNVIYILVPKLKTMGFNSLKNVTGPGEIYLSYEKEQQNNMGIPDGEQCFSKEEIIFLSYHPQFRRKMYPNCETEDPCFRLDTRKQEYFLEDIPDGCTAFAGLLCVLGPYQQNDAVMQKFKNLTILIGQLQVMGTLLDRLDTIFPKLQVVYPYRIPNLEYFVTETSVFRCMGSPLDYDPVASQYVHVGLNRFLTTMSLPSLLPIRPIDVSLPIYDDFMPNGFKKALYLPDTIQDHCSYFPQFNSSQCQAFRGLDKYPDTPIDTGLDTVWLFLMIVVILGIILSLRTMVLLKFSDVTDCLPYSRYLIIIILATATLTAIENCLFYQHAEHKEIFEEDAPATQFLQYDNDELTVYRTNRHWIEQIPMDVWGAALPSFCDVCDLIMLITSIIFYALRLFKIGSSQYPFSLLILLVYSITMEALFQYFQLSINRFRHYLLHDILLDNYCARATLHGLSRERTLNCYQPYYLDMRTEANPVNSVDVFADILIDESTWNKLRLALEKLPYLFYPIVSFVCWRFARYHSYLGPALRFRIIKRKKNNLPTSRMESVMDHTELES